MNPNGAARALDNRGIRPRGGQSACPCNTIGAPQPYRKGLLRHKTKTWALPEKKIVNTG